MLGEPIGIYKFEDKFTEPSTTTKTFKGPKVKPNTIVVLHTLTVADYTTSNKKLMLGRKGGDGNDHYVHVEKYTGIYETHLRGRMILLPSEQPIGVVESPTASDVLYFSAYGFVYKRE